VLIPEGVAQETRAYFESHPESGRAPDLDAVSWLEVVEVPAADLLGAGAQLVGPHKSTEKYRFHDKDVQRPELEAILLAAQRKAELVIEDGDGAACAVRAGVPKIWTTASLLVAMEQGGHLESAQASARKIQATGYHQADLMQLAGLAYDPRLVAGAAYDPKRIEPKWQARWRASELSRAGARPDAPKKYVLEMFPYPSGNMHMGHVRNYLIGDVLARYYRMRGFDVLHPFGWDALGLPAENAAIKDQRHPKERTRENIALFKEDTQALGLSYDWSREVNTSDPEYYKWNQWFFVKMLEKGIVYRRTTRVNWCPGCATVIANEQVKDDGTCERSADVVEQREMPEWAFRITAYAQDLLDGLDTLKEWPDRITASQRHWLGRSEGAEIDFALQGRSDSIRVFTTRVDTIYGCTYVVVAPAHPLVAQVAQGELLEEARAMAAAQKGVAAQRSVEDGAEKVGFALGVNAVNPFTGEAVPVWVANFVVATYGTGAVMSVPAHDARDFAFAQKYGLPIEPVIRPASPGVEVPSDAAFTDDGVLEASGPFTGETSAQARAAMTAHAEAQGFGHSKITWHLRDWGFSRQRYWGTPIPIVYCEKCDPDRRGIPVPIEQLPVTLPDIDVAAVLTGRGEPPLSKVPAFVNTTCPRCGGPARREVETMDTFVDSTWYYARYLSPHDATVPFQRAEADRWLPVDVYVGGPEHAVMHLLYFRFWTRVMKELGLLGVDEPVKRLITQGMVLKDGRKMGKRWGNVVSPREVIARYGADTARAFVMFAGPPENDIEWSFEQVEGVYRFFGRLWRLAAAHPDAVGQGFEGPVEGDALAIRRIAHKCLKRMTESMEKLSFNTAIAGAMEAVNALHAVKAEDAPNVRAAWAEALRILAVGLSPFAPHLADELAEIFGDSQSLQAQAWPAFDSALVVDDTVTYAVQVNGKLRGQVALPLAAGEAEVRAAAEALDAVGPHLAGKAVRKFVFVPKRLVNFVVG